MAFNIYQKAVNRYGEPDEKKAAEYQEQLFKLFVESPEGQALFDEGIRPVWADTMMEYGFGYLGVTPAQMTPNNLREILLDIFPRKVSAEPEEAPNMIRELQAFWRFLQREFQLENAAACLKILDDKAVRQLKKEMSNPANFGMAKSFVMMGKERGFDMTTEEGINEWMKTYNAELGAGTGQRVPSPISPRPTTMPTIPTMPPFTGTWGGSSRRSPDKSKSRMARSSRKKNRKRKS
jgi:hypothetical protein